MKSEWYTPALVPRFNIPLPPQPVFRASPFPQTDFAYARANMMRKWGGGMPYAPADALSWAPYGQPAMQPYLYAPYPGRTPWAIPAVAAPPLQAIFLETGADESSERGAPVVDGMAHSRMARILALHRALRASGGGGGDAAASAPISPATAALIAELTGGGGE